MLRTGKVMTNYFMDPTDTLAPGLVSERALLLGAVRLPNNTDCDFAAVLSATSDNKRTKGAHRARA